jgi:hypothetical protein
MNGVIDVFVTSFPKPGEKHRVSPSQGTHPRWSRDGRELFYRSLGERRKLVAVAVDTRGGRLRLGAPQALFDDTYLLGAPYTHVDYDVAPDGRFIFVEDPPEAPAPHQIVLIPWLGPRASREAPRVRNARAAPRASMPPAS